MTREQRDTQTLKQKKAIFRARSYRPFFSWLFIIFLLGLFFVPYAWPGTSLVALGNYGAVSTVPMITAAILRARKGSLVVSILFTLGMCLTNIFKDRLPWTSSPIIQVFVGVCVIMLIGFTIGQLSHMRSVMKRLHTDLQEANSFIQHQALTDPLTNLPNHRALMQQLEQEQARVGRSGEPLSAIFFDCDHFKRVNDTYGHSVGDAVLIALGERAKSMLRVSDTVGRYGGEEFVILLPETNNEQATLVAERLRKAVAGRSLATDEDGHEVSATISIGIATYPEDGVSGTELLSRADQAMYWAKTHGRNRVYSIAQVLDARESTFSA